VRDGDELKRRLTETRSVTNLLMKPLISGEIILICASKPKLKVKVNVDLYSASSREPHL